MESKYWFQMHQIAKSAERTRTAPEERRMVLNISKIEAAEYTIAYIIKI